MIYHLSITKHRDDPYRIAIHKTRHDMMMGYKADYYEAKNAEELLDLLVGVYGWLPEEWDGADEEVRDVKAQLFCCPGRENEKRDEGIHSP